MSTDTLAAPAATTDTFPINGTDYVEFYVGNAKQASHYYRTAFGFELVGYRGPETGVRDRASYLLQQDKIRLVLTTALRPDHPAAQHVHAARRRRPGHRALGGRCPGGVPGGGGARRPAGAGADGAPRRRRRGGASPRSSTYGDTIHTLVERRNYKGLVPSRLPPGRVAAIRPAPVGLKYVDHCVGNVELGRMNDVGRVLRASHGLQEPDLASTTRTSRPSTARSCRRWSSSGNERIKFPINEPAKGKKKSQIDEYLEFYRGPGVQHIALATDDIIETVTALRDRGVEFLNVPTTYYDDLQDRVGKIDEPVGRLQELGILVDRDHEGYLLQIFTKPVEDRPTLFYEIIQRKGARSFGKGNFKALFEAIEREQALRGNL